MTRDFYGTTHREARALADAWARDARLATHAATPANLTVRDWLAEWLDSVRGQVRPQTWTRYESLARLQLVPVLGGHPLTTLGAEDIRRLHLALAATTLSGTTRRHAHVVLGTALQAAVDQHLLAANPARTVKAPKATVREKTILSRDEASRLLAAARGDRLRALYVLALTTGMRIGELLALRWREVDLDTRVLTVAGTVVRTIDGDLVIQEPKTASGRRRVILSRIAVDSLRESERQTSLLFPNSAGGLMSSERVLKQHFRPLLVRADCPPSTTLHDLRHTCATHLLEDGVPAHVVSRLLGHASVGITLSTYAHVTPRLLDAAGAAMDARYGDEAGIEPPLAADVF